jgi:hypothetical protein
MVRPRWTDAAALAPLLFAIPVLSGVVTSLVNLGQTSDPYLGFATTATNVDAEAVFLGLPLYQDPAHGYTGLPLSPLFPTLVGGLDHLAIWSGWGIILSVCSAGALAAFAGALAYRAAVAAGAARLPLLGGAIGIGAIAWWLVSCLSTWSTRLAPISRRGPWRSAACCSCPRRSTARAGRAQAPCCSWRPPPSPSSPPVWRRWSPRSGPL